MACQFTARIPELADNLVALYARSTPEDIASGVEWYPNARICVNVWAEQHKLSRATVACIVAALSPQNDWKTNLIQAGDVVAGIPPRIGGIRANITKAQRIYTDRAESTLPYFPCGPKVASFALNLAGSDTAVTVDTHAAQAALADVASTVWLKWQPYLCFVSAYEIAANYVSQPASTFQAIIWHTWKRLHPPKEKQRLRQQWSVIGEY